MRFFPLAHVMLIGVLLVASGCSSNKGKIEGTKWTSVASNVKGKEFPAGTLVLEFGSDKKLVYKTPVGTFTGTYSLGMGDNVTLNLDTELAGRKQHVEKVKIEGDKLTMTDSDGTAMSFVKSN
jgi:hypothetical protein